MGTVTETEQSTREVVERYLASGHTSVEELAEDAVFTVMATGEEYRGREGVSAMLDYFYRQAFEAVAEPEVTLFGPGHAMVETTFRGRHTGEFAGVAATGQEVSVPLCVVYDVAGGQITRGRVYFEVPALMSQLHPAG